MTQDYRLKNTSSCAIKHILAAPEGRASGNRLASYRNSILAELERVSLSASACRRQLRVSSGLPENQDVPADRSTLRDHSGRFAQSNFRLLSLPPCPQHKLGTRRLMRETRDSYPT